MTKRETMMRQERMGKGTVKMRKRKRKRKRKGTGMMRKRKEMRTEGTEMRMEGTEMRMEGTEMRLEGSGLEGLGLEMKMRKGTEMREVRRGRTMGRWPWVIMRTTIMTTYTWVMTARLMSGWRLVG